VTAGAAGVAEVGAGAEGAVVCGCVAAGAAGATGVAGAAGFTAIGTDAGGAGAATDDAGAAGGALPGGIGWYRKTFTVPPGDSGRLVFVEFRLEDDRVPIKLVHKMTERQVIKEMAEFKELKHAGTSEKLPWQHVITFTKQAGKR